MDWVKIEDVHKERLKGNKVWFECSEDQYYDLLEALPPLDMNRSGFLMGEKYTHEEGKGVYAALKTEEGRHYLTLATLKEYKEGYQSYTHQ